MHSFHLRSIAALLVLLGLSACGGKESFSVNGTISRLDFGGLELANGSDKLSPPAATTTFVFSNRIDYGTKYNVTILQNPEHMKCSVNPNTSIGSAGRTERINVPVTCTINTYAIGGTITGLTSTGLELSNGTNAGTVLPAPNGGADVQFTLPNTVDFGQPYGVGVLKDPAGQTCSVNDKAIGTMGDAPVTDIVVTCGPATT
jgi:hypothetical protein